MKSEGDGAALSMVRAAARSVGPVGSLVGHTAAGVLKYVAWALWLYCVGFGVLRGNLRRRSVRGDRRVTAGSSGRAAVTVWVT